MTSTIEHRPPEGAEYEPYRAAALGFIATGMTAAGVRAHAADARYVERTARIAGLTEDRARTELLEIAGAISAWEDRGMTRRKAYFLARLDETEGPYPGPTAA